MLLNERRVLKIHMPRSALMIIVPFFLIATGFTFMVQPVSSFDSDEPEVTQNSLYTISYKGNLVRLDIAAESFNSVVIGPLGQPFNSEGARTEGLAMGPDGILYAAVNFKDAESELYRINPQTAEATLVGSMGQRQVDGLSFAKDGTLYGVTSRTGLGGSGYGSKLIEVNTETGEMIIVNPELWLDDLDALAINPDDMAIAADGETRCFYQIDLTGESDPTRIGRTPEIVPGLDLEGAAFGTDGYLYATTNLTRPDVSYLIRIDPTQILEYTDLGSLGFFVNSLASTKASDPAFLNPLLKSAKTTWGEVKTRK